MNDNYNNYSSCEINGHKLELMACKDKPDCANVLLDGNILMDYDSKLSTANYVFAAVKTTLTLCT